MLLGRALAASAAAAFAAKATCAMAEGPASCGAAVAGSLAAPARQAPDSVVVFVGRCIVVDAATVFAPGVLVARSRGPGQPMDVHTVGDPRDPSVGAALRECGTEALVVECSLLIPGLVDIHTHGVGGHEDVTLFWTNPTYSLRAAAASGTTSLLATLTLPSAAGHCCGPLTGAAAEPGARGTVPTVRPELVAALSRAVGRLEPGCAVLEGVHAEGPIVADLGGLPPGEQCMTLDRFRELCDCLGPMMRAMTISPSKEARPSAESGAAPCARLGLLLERGVTPCLGHDKQCTDADIVKALAHCARAAVGAGTEAGTKTAHFGTASHDGLDSGATAPADGACVTDPRSRGLTALQRFPSSRGVPPPHITHLFNVCSFHHRDAGLANAGLLDRLPGEPGLAGPSVELIGDLVHVHPWAIAATLAARESSAVCFVTDSIAEPRPGYRLSYAGRHLAVQAVVAETGTREAGSPAGDAGSATDPPACRVVLEGTDTIAGSCDTLWSCLNRLVTRFRLPLPAAVACVSENPARVAGLPHVGTLRPGCRADAIALGVAEMGQAGAKGRSLSDAVAAVTDLFGTGATDVRLEAQGSSGKTAQFGNVSVAAPPDSGTAAGDRLPTLLAGLPYSDRVVFVGGCPVPK